MKTNFHPRNRPSKWRKYAKATLLVVAVLILGMLLFALTGAKVLSFASPLWKAKNAAGAWSSGIVAIFESKHKLAEENRRLREETASYEAERAFFASFAERERELLALLGRAREISSIAAGVLVHPPETPYDMLVADVGSSSGAAVGSRVMMSEGPIIGVVTETSGRSLRIKLYSTSGERTNAVLERGNVPVVLEGLGGGNFKIVLPRDMAVEPGDRVLSPGLGSELLAIVGSVSTKPTDSSKTVSARSPANIFSISRVLIERR